MNGHFGLLEKAMLEIFYDNFLGIFSIIMALEIAWSKN